MIKEQYPLYCNKPNHENEQVYGLTLGKNNSQVYCHRCYSHLFNRHQENQSDPAYDINQLNYQTLELESIQQRNNIQKQSQRLKSRLINRQENEVENLIIDVIKIKDNTFRYLDQERMKVSYDDIQSLQDLGFFITEICKFYNNEFILEKDKIIQEFLEIHQKQLYEGSFLDKINPLLNEFKQKFLDLRLQTLDLNYYFNGTFDIILETIVISDKYEVIALGSQDGEIIIYKDKLLKQKYNESKFRIIKMEINKNSQEQYIYVLRQKKISEYSLHKYGIDQNQQDQMSLSLNGNYVDFALLKNNIYYNNDGKLFQIHNSKIKLDTEFNEDINKQISKIETIKSFDIYYLSQLRYLLITEDNRIIHLIDNDSNQIQQKILYENQKQNDIITICKFIDPFQFLVGGYFKSLLLYKLNKSSLILENIIPTDLYCQYLQINNKLLVYSDGFRFQIMDYYSKISKISQNGNITKKTVNSNKQGKSKFWTQHQNGDIEYIIFENKQSKILRIQI